MNWTRDEAIDMCTRIEEIAPKFGAHVALTGGCLYKDGRRKDADIMFYRIRQVEEIDVDGLMEELQCKLGISPGKDHGFVYKATYGLQKIDFFFPERPEMIAVGDGTYVRP